METVKVYLDEARRGFVVCQQCGKSKQIEFPNGQNPRSGKVKCTCGNSFSVIFESRRHYRKQVNTFGKCFAQADTFDGSLVQVIDISMSGMGFVKMDGRPLKLNEKIRLSFPLGDGTIHCVASVLSVGKGGMIGVKFIDVDEHSKKVLGFFLLP